MVQLKCDLNAPNPGKPDNTYWALGVAAATGYDDIGRLWDEHYVDQTDESVIAHNNRMERGLLDYKRCTVAELESFIIARQLEFPRATSICRVLSVETIHHELHSEQEPGHGEVSVVEATHNKATQDAYIAILQAADDSAVFTKFLELPPELREIIYMKYFENIPPLPALPHHPPIRKQPLSHSTHSLVSLFDPPPAPSSA
jgi:hypothetical protein